ncbi:MAG: hypothetical protein ACI865_000654 [Flavobacteriaceae bacterium]|jgi:hypothetical protein
MMMKGIKHTLAITGIILFASQLLGQVRVEVEEISNGSSFESIEEIQRVPFNDFFKEINPLEMTFKPLQVIDSANWIALDMYALDDLDLGDVEFRDEDKYYGIGRYEYKTTTYYFVAMPLTGGGWNVTVMICNESGEFTDGYTIAYTGYEGEGKINIHGWVEYNKRRDELVFITRAHVYFHDSDSGEDATEELRDCEAFCLREGEIAPYDKVDVDGLNKKYQMDITSD